MKAALLVIVTVAIVSALAPVQAEDNTSGSQPTVQTVPEDAAKKKQEPLKDRIKEFEDKVKDGTVTADDQPSLPK